MIPLPEFKKILGQKAEGKTDQEIEVIRDTLDKFADAIFDKWLLKRNADINNNDCNGSLPMIKF